MSASDDEEKCDNGGEGDVADETESTDGKRGKVVTLPPC